MFIRALIRALVCAELGRAEEARRDFAQARADLKLALGDKPGQDRVGGWSAGRGVVYVAEQKAMNS